MANYTTGSATGPGALNNFYVALRDHLVANGWTQHDIISASAGSRDVVFRSGALDVTADVRAFVRLNQNSTTQITATAYSDWDTSTHVGMNTAGTAAGSAIFIGQDATFTYYFWADAFGCLYAGKIGASISRAYLGMPRRCLDLTDNGMTASSGSITAGATSISVTSNMVGKLRVGQKVQLINFAHNSASANASHAEAVTLTSVGTSSLGVTAVSQNYDSGTLIGENVCSTFVGGSTTTSIGTAFCAVLNPDGTRTAVNGQTINATGTINGTESNVDPGDISGKYGVGLVGLTTTTASKTDFRGIARGTIFVAIGTQAIEDIMASGPYTYIVFDIAGAGGIAMGPRES